MQTATQKQIAKDILGIVHQAIEKAMKTIDVHEGRYMKRELKLKKALTVGKRRYVHTAEYWKKFKASHKRTYTKRSDYWNS